MEGKLRTMSSHELVEAKESLIGQIYASNSVFQPGVLSPTTTADIILSSSTDAMKVCQDYGILSAKETLPDPSKCHATGSGLGSVMVGETAKVVVQAVNHWGEPCDVPQGLRCNIVSVIKNKPEIISTKCMKKGHYELCFIPALKGHHNLNITINDQHIRGSPFTLLARSLERIGEAISAINIKSPCGIVINHKRQIVVTEYNKHLISVYTQSGVKLRSFGGRGSKEGEFNHPIGVAVDEDDNILVADYKNNRIQKFTSEGEFLVGTKGNKILQFKGPKAIAFNTFNKKIYVSDNDNVQILNSDLTYCRFFKDFFSNSIGCDRSGRVYLSKVSGQIIVFSANGDLLRKFENNSILNSSDDVAIDDDNKVLYTSNCINGQVSVYTLEGDILYSFSMGVLSTPLGLAVDSGVLYVCSNHYNYIKIY